jgi:hypothetical protein
MAKKDRTIRLPEPTFLPKKCEVKVHQKYYPEYSRQVYFLALLGLNEAQMAQVFHVDVKQIAQWKNTHPEFGEAVKRGKVEADGRVVFSLFQAAVGYEHKDCVVLTNRVKEFDNKGRVTKEWTEPLIVDVIKRYPPNVTAALKWLQARQPGVWSDRINISGKLNITHQLDLTDFSNEELEMLTAIGKSKNMREVEDAEQQEIA